MFGSKSLHSVGLELWYIFVYLGLGLGLEISPNEKGFECKFNLICWQWEIRVLKIIPPARANLEDFRKQ